MNIMKKTILALVCAFSLLGFACKSKAKTTKSENGTVNTETAGEQKVKYRLVVSFTSHASGIDGAKYDAIENFIKAHPKKPAYELLPWGREGERDILMQLTEMDSKEQKTFIDDLKKLAQGSDRVFVNENTERAKKAN